MSNRSSSALNPEQGLASIPVVPLLKRVGLTPELIADQEQRLSVQSQIRLLDETAIALKDD